MDLVKLGRLDLWYASFFRVSICIPVLLAALWHHVPLRDLITYTALILMNYYLTSAVNYYTDIGEDSRKRLMGGEDVRPMDPDNPLVPVANRAGRRRVFFQSLAVYALGTGVLVAWTYFYVERPYIILLHHGVLFAVGITYSLGPRLKESLGGFLIASMLYWYPVFIVMTHTTSYTITMLTYLALTMVVGIGDSIQHTVHHHIIDAGAGRKTLANRIGVGRAKKLAGLVIAIAYVIAMTMGYMLSSIPLILVALYFLYGHIRTGAKFWVLYFFILYLNLLWILYMEGLLYAATLVASVMALPVFIAPSMLPAYMRDEMFGPLRTLLIKDYHTLYNYLHDLKHGGQ